MDQLARQSRQTNLDQIEEAEEQENEEIKNFITTMKKEDIEVLRKSMMLSSLGNSKEFKEKLNYDVEDSLENLPEQKTNKQQDPDDEIVESIGEDDDDDINPTIEQSYKTDAFKISTSRYGVPTPQSAKPIKTIKARPISATNNQVFSSRNYETIEKKADYSKPVSPKVEIPITKLDPPQKTKQSVPNPFKSYTNRTEETRIENTYSTRETDSSGYSSLNKQKVPDVTSSSIS